MEMSDSYCRNCGNAIQPLDHFCQKCGSPVDSKPISEKHTQATKPKEGEEGLVNGSQRQSKYGAIIVLGIGLLLIAAAVGFYALLSGAPTLIAQTTATPSTATSEFISMTQVPAVLQDKIVYFRTPSLPAATAFPKNGNDTFLVVLYTVPSNSWLYPEDLDWTILDETNHELESIGFGTPHNFEDPQTPVLIMFMGRLLEGPLIVRSSSDLAAIAVVFVVPKGINKITLLNPQKQEYSVLIYTSGLILDSGLIPTVEFDSSFIEQPDGSENWAFTP